MKALKGPLAAALLAVALALPLSPLGAPALGGEPTAAASDYVVASPPMTVIAPEAPLDFVNGTAISYPEISFDSAGNIVLAYHESGSPYFARFNGSSAQVLTRPTQVSNRTTNAGPFTDVGRGPHAALNSLGQIVTAYWDFVDPGPGLKDRVYLASNDLNGTPVLAETLVGESLSYFWPSPSVAIGLNNSVYVAREVSDGDTLNSAIGLEHRLADGSPDFTYLTVFNDSGQEHYPQLVPDLARSRLVLAWYNDSGEVRLAALGLNGSMTWGPVAIQSATPGFSLTVGPDGVIYLVFVNSLGEVRASKFSADGSILADRTLLEVPVGLWARVPRCALSPQGDLYVVWQEEDGSGLGDIRATELNASTMTPVVSPSWISREVGGAEMPHLAFSPAGVPWVVWRANNAPLGLNDTINGTSLSRRTFSFSARTQAQDLTVYRGEPNDIPVNITSSSAVAMTYSLDFTLSSVRGPWNWTVEFFNAVTGAPAMDLPVPANGSAAATARVTPPVWDPPGNGLILFVVIREPQFTGATVALLLNLTAQGGHRYAFAPLAQNASGLAGSTAQIAFQVRNEGVFEALDLPIMLDPAPPAGWSASIFPRSFSALPGEAQVITVTVTSPTSGTSADVYCGSLTVQHPVDVFALATARFCSGVALVADPTLTPASQVLTVDSGVVTPLHFTVENRGNSASALRCHLTIVEPLPAGWAISGSPWNGSLWRNVPTVVTWGVTLLPPVQGGDRLDLTVQASCEGTPAVQNASLVFFVREVHDARWGVPPAGIQTNASGEASLDVALENRGNVPEPLATSTSFVPHGWTIGISWTVAGAPATFVGPGQSALATMEVRAPRQVEAGTYRFDLSLGGGTQPGNRLSLTVDVPPVAGILADFGPASVSAGPNEVVSFTGRVVHTGNTAIVYKLSVNLASFQVWAWSAEFTSTTGGGSLTLGGRYLDLPAFAEGTLYIYITAPGEPTPGELAVNITLSAATRASASFVGRVLVGLPDLHVEITAVPDGLAGPLLVGGILVNVTCTGGLLVANVTLRVTVDGVRLFDAPVGPLCQPGALSFEITVSLASGVHSVTASVDPEQPGANPFYGFILEEDETNNVATRSFSIGEGPAPPPPPPTIGAGAGLGSAAILLLVAAGAGAAAVAGLLTLRQRRGRSPGP